MDTVFWLLLAFFLCGGFGFKYSWGGKARLRLGSVGDRDDDHEYLDDDDDDEDEEEEEAEDEGQVLERQAALEVITSRLEAAGFRVTKQEEDGEPGEIGCLQIIMTRRWCCSNCEEERHLHELYEYALLEPPTKTAPMVAGWKRLGWICLHCGKFYRTKRCFSGGILGQLLSDGVNIKEMFVALRQSDLDIPARIKAIIEAQKEFWRRRIEGVEKTSQKLLAPMSRKNGKKTG